MTSNHRTSVAFSNKHLFSPIYGQLAGNWLTWAGLGWASLLQVMNPAGSYSLFHVSIPGGRRTTCLGGILMVKIKYQSLANHILRNTASTLRPPVCMTSPIFPWAKVSHMTKPKVKEVQGRTSPAVLHREIIPSVFLTWEALKSYIPKNLDPGPSEELELKKNQPATLLFRAVENIKCSYHMFTL